MFKKWSKVFSELEKAIATIETIEDSKNCFNQFESIEESIRDEFAPNIYLQMWIIAFNIGKLSLASNYAEKAINYLIHYKRIPQINLLLKSIKETGLLKNKINKYFEITEILNGKSCKKNLNLEHLDHLTDHPEFWKQSSEFLKRYLLSEDDWNLDFWKLCYEFILLNYFDHDIFKTLFYKTGDLKNDKYQKKFQELLKTRNIKVNRFNKNKNKDKELLTKASNEKLLINYDQVAMDLLSGEQEPNFEVQRRVINSIKFITEEELIIKGQEMIVAFELLSMEQVVILLCEKMINLLTDVKQRARIFYVWAQALLNSAEYYKVIDLVDDILYSEDVYGEERFAFLYVKAEACVKLNKIKMAKGIYISIQKQHPEYRLVGERLKLFETT